MSKYNPLYCIKITAYILHLMCVFKPALTIYITSYCYAMIIHGPYILYETGHPHRHTETSPYFPKFMWP